jgi:hypothetical protein
MAREGETGWLAAQSAPAPLADALRRTWNARSEWPRFHQRCREQAVREYGLGLQARRYEDVFASMAAGREVSQEALDRSAADQTPVCAAPAANDPGAQRGRE